MDLVSGACFSEPRITLTCVDKDASKIEGLKLSDIPFYEPDLDELPASNAAAGHPWPYGRKDGSV